MRKNTREEKHEAREETGKYYHVLMIEYKERSVASTQRLPSRDNTYKVPALRPPSCFFICTCRGEPGNEARSNPQCSPLRGVTSTSLILRSSYTN